MSKVKGEQKIAGRSPGLNRIGCQATFCIEATVV
jgi:hypothetical protein